MTTIPNTILYQPKALKSFFLIYPNKKRIAIMETTKATIIPVNKIPISKAEKSKPNLSNFNTLAPNITGIERKNEYSAAILRDVPSRIAPRDRKSVV